MAWKPLLFASVAVVWGGAAQAQTAPDGKAGATVDEVVVTGTQLRGVAPVGSALTSVSAEDIQAAGQTSIVQMLNKLPQIFNIGVSETSRGQTGGTSNNSYSSSINIRGISPYATLTLIDGQNMTPGEARAEVVDASHIPSNMVQRVEIVADGGSAIYGAEAIAGVANLILRRGYEGVGVSARYAASNHGAEEYFGQFTVGHRWSSGQFTMGVERSFRSDIQFKDLDFTGRDQRALGGADIRVTQCAPGTVQITSAGVTTNYPIPAGGVTPATAGSLRAGELTRCELYAQSDARPQQRRTSFAFTFDQDLNDTVSFFGEGWASRRNFRLYNTPVGATLTVPSTNPYFVAPAGVTAPLCSAAVNTTYGTPAGTRCLTVQYNYIDDIGIHNPITGFSINYHLIAGLKVKLPHDWLATASANYGWNSDYYIDRSYARINTSNLNSALAGTNPAGALNVFGGPNPRALIDAYSPNSIFNQVLDSGGHTIVKTANVKVDGPLFNVPAGAVRAAVGYRRYEFSWWFNSSSGLLTAPEYTSPTDVERRIDSFFAEVNVPLISADMNVPGVRTLDLNFAGRSDGYNDIGTTRNPKVGIRYEPFRGMQIHASYGASFRSPNVFDIYGQSNNLTVTSQSDPTVGAAVQTLLISGGNPNIKPETAKTYSLGFDLNPDFAPGLKIGVNYFKIRIDNQIVGFGSDPAVLSKEAQLAGTGIITRNPSVAFLQSILAGRKVTAGTLPADLTAIKIFLDGRPTNLGSTFTSGFDISASYALPTENWGRFVASVNGLYFDRYEDRISDTAPKVDHLNTIFYPPKWRARYALDWSNGPWAASVTLNHLNAYTSTLVTPFQKVRATLNTDVRLAYDLQAVPGVKWAHGANIALDIQNLFDRDPPLVLGNGTGVLGANSQSSPNGGAGFDPTKAFILGRMVGVTLSSRF